MFNTVLYHLRSAKNIGLIARSHIAFGGDYLILIGAQSSWKFQGGQHSYTRQLMEQNKLVLFNEFEEFLKWNGKRLPVVAIEISESSTLLPDFDFPRKANLVLGSETNGLPNEMLQNADEIVTIPQKGSVGSLNVSQSATIVHYAATISHPISKIEGNKFIC